MARFFHTPAPGDLAPNGLGIALGIALGKNLVASRPKLLLGVHSVAENNGR